MQTTIKPLAGKTPFEPFELIITVETEIEHCYLWNLFNQSIASVERYSSNSFHITSEQVASIENVHREQNLPWHGLDKMARKFGLK